MTKARSHDARIGAITNACVEFDHWNEALHVTELKLGSAHALCQVLSMTEDDDEIRMICAAIEMVFRASQEAVHESFHQVGNALVPLLLRLLDRCEAGNMRNADVSIMNISKVLLYFSRIQEVRVPLSRQFGLLDVVVRVSTSLLNEDSRITRLRILANLANSSENKSIMVNHPDLLDSLLRIANLDPSNRAREYAAATLMDLTSSSSNQVEMAKNDKLIAVLIKLSLFFDDETEETREFAITALQNLAFAKENRKRLISFGGGMVIETLKKNLVSNPIYKARRRAAGTLTNLATEETAEELGTHPGLLQALAIVSKKDGNTEVRDRASLALTKMSNNLTTNMSCHASLLDALVLSASDSNISSFALVMRSKTKNPENKLCIAKHKGVLETLSRVCISKLSSPKDRENAMKSIMHLAHNETNRKAMATKIILDAATLCAGLVGFEHENTRDSAVITLERLGTEVSNRKAMACHEGLITVIAKATEREAHSERKGIDPQAERLAKALLMSLLLAL